MSEKPKEEGTNKKCEVGSYMTGVYVPCRLPTNHPGKCMSEEDNPIMFGGCCDGSPD
mgnify:CR=1 FL=1